MNDSSKIIDVISSNLDKVREQLDPGLFISALLAALIAAFAASALYRIFYERRGTGSQVHRSFPLLAIAITTLFVGVQISIPLSLGLLGSLSIIRFRTPVKEPEEVGFIMLVIAASISAATFNFAFIAYMYAAAIIALLIMRGAATARWLRRDGLIVLTMSKDVALASYSSIEALLRERTGRLTLESSASHGGQTTYQYVFSSLKCDVATLEAGLGGIAPITSLSVFLDRPGGIK